MTYSFLPHLKLTWVLFALSHVALSRAGWRRQLDDGNSGVGPDAPIGGMQDVHKLAGRVN